MPVAREYLHLVPAVGEPRGVVGERVGGLIVGEVQLRIAVDVELYLALRQVRLLVPHRRAYERRAVSRLAAWSQVGDDGSRVLSEGPGSVQATACDQLACHAGLLVHRRQDAGLYPGVARLRELALVEGRYARDVRRRHRGAEAVTVLVARQRAEHVLSGGREVHRHGAVVREAREL